MPTVILARHGRTTANTAGVLAGRTKGVHLDDTGVEQARAAARRLEGVPLAAVVSSPLERCRETARLLAGTSVKVSTDRRLTECDYGEWTGRSLKELAREKMWRTVQVHPAAAQFPAGESLAEMSARAVAAVRDHDVRLEAEVGPDAVWVAVSHGDVIKAVLADALGTHLDAFQRIMVDPASLSVVRYGPTRPFVLGMNTSSGSLAHLAPSPRKGRQRGTGRSPRSADDAILGGGAGPTAPTA
ncbi:MAG: MSMEG_4193 family putative phosphomutase [Actinomycetota bacterium]|nr:MSMEG_4193 family putative phosphomutase [Actinomycetota bacterium]